MAIFTGNKQFDFQIDRFTSPFLDNTHVRQDREKISSFIKDFQTWFDWWSKKLKNTNKEMNLK